MSLVIKKIGRQDLMLWDGTKQRTFGVKSPTGGVMQLDKIGYEVDTYAIGGEELTDGTISKVVNSIPSDTDVEIMLKPGTWEVTSNLTIPSNITLDIRPDAVLNVASGVTLTINGHIKDTRRQIFSGAGSFVIGARSVEFTRPEWWYSGSGTWTSAIQWAIDTAHGYCGNVRLPEGVLDVTGGTIYIQRDTGGSASDLSYAPLVVRGAGKVKPNTAAYYIFDGCTILNKDDAGDIIRINIDSDGARVASTITTHIGLECFSFKGTEGIATNGIWTTNSRLYCKSLHFEQLNNGIDGYTLPTGATNSYTDLSWFEEISMVRIGNWGMWLRKPDCTHFLNINMTDFQDTALGGIYMRGADCPIVKSFIYNRNPDASVGIDFYFCYSPVVEGWISTERYGTLFYSEYSRCVSISQGWLYNYTTSADSSVIFIRLLGNGQEYGGHRICQNYFQTDRGAGSFDVLVKGWNCKAEGNMHVDANQTTIRDNQGIYIDKATTGGSGTVDTKCYHVNYQEYTISALSQVDGLATATTSVEHGIKVDSVLRAKISGAVESEYNDSFADITITGVDSFTYAVDAGASTPATGSPIVDLWLLRDIEDNDLTYDIGQPVWDAGDDIVTFPNSDVLKYHNTVSLTKMAGSHIPTIFELGTIPVIQFEDFAGATITTQDTSMNFIMVIS